MKQSFVISSKGQLVFVHSDEAVQKLSKIGEVNISRASNVNFNNQTKQWEAKLTGSNRPILVGDTLTQTLEREKDYVETNLSNYADR